MARALDADEEAFARQAARAGLAVDAARVLAALARGGGWSALDLMEATGLSRRDLVAASRELEGRGLLRVEGVPTGGRPQKRYFLPRSPRDAVRALTRARREELAGEAAALDALDARFP